MSTSDTSKVVLIEDEAVIRMVAADTLSEEEITIYEASDAAEALAVL